MSDPYKKDIKVRFGDTKEVFFRVRERAWDTTLNAWVPGDYRDLTGVVVTAQIRETHEAVAPLVSFTCTLGDQTDVALGRGAVSCKLSAATTASINRGVPSGVWDCQFSYPSGEVFTYIEGDVSFDKDVTR